MKYLVIVKADFNDADYVEESTFNATEEDIKFVRKVAKIVLNYKKPEWKPWEWDHNWPDIESWSHEVTPYKMYKDVLTENEIENFDGFLPYHEGGIHSIESIEIIKYDSVEKL